jgi:hypothetical protein
MGGEVELRRESIPPHLAIEGEWRTLEAAACPSFSTSN